MKIIPLHPWNLSPEEAIAIQIELRKKISLKRTWKKLEKIAALDVAYFKDKAIGGVLIFKYPELVLLEKVFAVLKVDFPYIPGLLTMREAPCLIEALKKIKKEPDLLMFDGQGIAHPRRMGIATHLGIYLNRPSLGCAKSKLVGEYKMPSEKEGASEPLWDKSELVGLVVRTKTRTRPVFVSPGNLIDFETALKIVLSCCRGHRIPEPLRLAHIFVNKIKSQYCKEGI